jgi:hypothetical protein
VAVVSRWDDQTEVETGREPGEGVVVSDTPGVVEAPNLLQLEGGGISVTYTTTDIAGQPRLVYQSATAALSFSGDEIRTAESELGLLVTVSLVRTVDVGGTTFTLVVPEIDLVGVGTASVRTFAVTSVHRLLAGAIGHPQRTSYTTVSLVGSASQVDSLRAGS